jgi:hypothetical protein
MVITDVSGSTGCPETSVTTLLCCVKSQKSANVIHTAAEDSNHAGMEALVKRKICCPSCESNPNFSIVHTVACQQSD